MSGHRIKITPATVSAKQRAPETLKNIAFFARESMAAPTCAA